MSIAVWFRESDEFPNGVVTYDDHAAEVKRLTAERDEARAVADHRAALEAEVERLTKLAEVGRANHRALWMALNMVRDAIEEVGPVSVLPSIEYEGVDPAEIAGHFALAIAKLADKTEVERLREALTELADLMDAVRQGEYVPDSFTTQPARAALAGEAQDAQ